MQLTKQPSFGVRPKTTKGWHTFKDYFENSRLIQPTRFSVMSEWSMKEPCFGPVEAPCLEQHDHEFGHYWLGHYYWSLLTWSALLVTSIVVTSLPRPPTESCRSQGRNQTSSSPSLQTMNLSMLQDKPGMVIWWWLFLTIVTNRCAGRYWRPCTHPWDTQRTPILWQRQPEHTK